MKKVGFGKVTLKILCAVLCGALLCGAVMPAFALGGDLPALAAGADSPASEWNFGRLIYDGAGVRHSVVPYYAGGVSPDTSGYGDGHVFPEKYCAADDGLLNPPEAQAYGDCWAYSVITTLEANAAKQGFGKKEFSKSHLTYFTLTPEKEGLAPDNVWESGANSVYASFALSNLEGIANKADFPNKTADNEIPFTEADRFNRGSGYIIDTAAVMYDADEVKQWLLDNGAAVMSYCEEGTYAKNEELGSYMIYNGRLDNFIFTANHAITVIGWDDTIPASAFEVCGNGKPNKDGAWIVQNSWFGNEDDIMYMSYGQPVSDFGGLTVRGDDAYANYTHSERGTSGYLFGKYVEQGDVFTARGDERISRVMFMADSFGQAEKINVNIKIYKNLPDKYTSPDDGTLAGSYKTVCTHDGLFSYEIKDFIGITKGEKYAVTISCEESGGHSIALQLEQDFEDVKYVSAARESYVRTSKDSAFIDADRELSKVSGEKGLHNTYVQVYTKCNHTVKVEDGRRICTACREDLSEVCAKHPGGYWRTTRKPTVTQDGEKTYLCTECASVIKTEKIPALNTAKVTIAKNMGTYKADYSDYLKLRAQVKEVPDGYHIEWFKDGKPAGPGTELTVLCENDMQIDVRFADAKGNILKDASGKEIGDSEAVKVNRGLFKLIVGFFRNLFRTNKVKTQ